jgi:hypothetical protein
MLGSAVCISLAVDFCIHLEVVVSQHLPAVRAGQTIRVVFLPPFRL